MIMLAPGGCVRVIFIFKVLVKIVFAVFSTFLFANFPCKLLLTREPTYKNADPYKDSCWYSVDDEQTKTYFPCTSGKLDTLDLSSVQGTNTWSIYADDKATNLSTEGVTFSVDTTTNVVDPVDSDKFYVKSYPNPGKDYITFQYSITKPGDVSLRIWNIKGQMLEELVKEYKLPGTHEVGFDASKLPSGAYPYRFISSEGTYTGKMAKKKF